MLYKVEYIGPETFSKIVNLLPLGNLTICASGNLTYFRNGFTPDDIDPHLCTKLNYEFAKLDPAPNENFVGEVDVNIETSFYNTDKPDEQNSNTKTSVGNSG